MIQEVYVKKNDEHPISAIQHCQLLKSNEFIQKSRFNLSLQEQKIILYLTGKINPADMELKEYVFEISDFCNVCDLGKDSGENYKYIKKTLKDLRDKSILVELGDDTEATLSWIDKVIITKDSGSVKIKFDDMIKCYLIQLQDKFTQAELFYTLAMKSQFSIRLYELLKIHKQEHEYIVTIEELKKKLDAENYIRFPDLKRYVLEIALREINELSDLNVGYTLEKESKRFAKFKFTVEQKKNLGKRFKVLKQVEQIIGSK